jgi:ATP-dependent RNA helicase DDX10/DBP4
MYLYLCVCVIINLFLLFFCKVLVIDEADRVLDLGFRDAMNAILAALPSEDRQTMLYSATQTQSVRQLAKLSLRDPQYIAVHEAQSSVTPSALKQHFMMVEATVKYDVLWSFIKTHLKSKVLIFQATCKQVRFTYEMFRKLRPGTPLMHMHGNMNQQKRMAIYYEFCEKPEATLIATDLAARGLDFPSVDWVVQADCPDDAETYIHRVGRTARYRAKGNALLLLLPSEAAMVPLLRNKKVPIKKTLVNPDTLMTVSRNFAGFLAEDPNLKFLAQKAFVGYVRSVYLQSNKEVFSVEQLPGPTQFPSIGFTGLHVAGEELARAMGLPNAPKMKFVKKTKKNTPYKLQELLEGKEIDASKQPKKKKNNIEKLLTRKNNTVLSDAHAQMRFVVLRVFLLNSLKLNLCLCAGCE